MDRIRSVTVGMTMCGRCLGTKCHISNTIVQPPTFASQAVRLWVVAYLIISMGFGAAKSASRGAKEEVERGPLPGFRVVLGQSGFTHFP